MDELSNQDHAVGLLQQLGLKEYEARAFVALSRLPRGTAREVSDVSEVPRTRVYDAIRVLETKGLVEIQHSSPQQFRAVSIDEAVDTLKAEYEDRTDTLRRALRGLESADAGGNEEVTHEVWSISGDAAIEGRTSRLLDEATREVVLVIGHEGLLTETLVDRLEAARDRGVDVVVGTYSVTLRDRVTEVLPEVRTFVSGLEWLSHSSLPGDETEIGRLVLIDRETILVSSFVESAGGDRSHEQAVFGRGFDNGLVTIVRRLMVTGLLSVTDDGA